ncbi:MAG: polysaccharide pyruvyl transferase family protein [Actinomycetota bacterium]|nr:polysaccharide pyruvyl transferase family protein [Actinomycetota bacterium]
MGDSRGHQDRPVVGLLGTFDLANFGDLLLPAVAEHELLRRMPDLVVRRFSPFGWEHPVPMDGGEVAEPLGAPTPERRAEVARECDALVIGGGEIIHFLDHLLAPHYDTTPEATVARAPSTWFVDGAGAGALIATAWNAVGIPFDIDDEHAPFVRMAASRHRYLAVRDDESRTKLESVGVEQEIAVVPDPGFLAPRVFDQAIVDRRRRFHRALGWMPPGRYITVQGNGSMVNEVDRISMALDAVLADHADIDIMLLETGVGHGDIEFAEAFRARHPGRVWAPSSSLLPIDFAAILGATEAFVGVSLHGAITATAYGRRAVVFNAPRQSKHRGLVSHLHDRSGYIESADELPAALRWALAALGPEPALASIDQRIDAHFDQLATMIETAWSLRSDATGDETGNARVVRLATELTAVRTAHATRGQRLLAERDALAMLLDRDDGQASELRSSLAASHDEIVRLNDDIGRISAYNVHVRDELERVLDDHTTAVQHADRLRADLRDAQVELDETRRALESVYATKTMRWLRGPRRVYGWFRR